MMNHSFYSSSQSSAFLTSEHHESFPSYNNYVGYSDYPHPSKFEPYEYRCLPTTTTTHNLLSYQNETLLDQIPASSASVLIQPMESVVPLSSVNLTQINGSASLSSTPHHHHHHLLHQHVYPNESSCSTPPNSIEPTSWIGSGDYQALPSTAPNNISPYRHYSTPCSLYSNNHFYDPTPVTSHQWQQTPLIPIKFESPSYFESSDSFNHPTGEPSTTNDDEKSDSSEQNHWLKPTSTSTPLVIIPPRNPLNGKELIDLFPAHHSSIDLYTRFHLSVRLEHDRSVNISERTRINFD